MRQTYLMLALILIVVLAAHFVKMTRANDAMTAALMDRLQVGQRFDNVEEDEDRANDADDADRFTTLDRHEAGRPTSVVYVDGE